MGKNFLALIAIVAFGIITFEISYVFLPEMLIKLMKYFFSTVSFIATYVAYPKIKKYMIDPYYPNGTMRDPDDGEEADEEADGDTADEASSEA